MNGTRRLVILFLLAALAGCGGSGSKFPAAHLSGRVTVDGEAVPEGSVTFIPQDKGQGQTAGCPIVAGSYDCPDAPKGRVIVRIVATKPTGKMIQDYGTPYAEKVSILPEKYQEGIPLTVEGDNAAQNFDLTK